MLKSAKHWMIKLKILIHAFTGNVTTCPGLPQQCLVNKIHPIYTILGKDGITHDKSTMFTGY